MDINDIYKYSNNSKFYFNAECSYHNFNGKKTAVLVWKGIKSDYVKEATIAVNNRRSGLLGTASTKYGYLGYFVFTKYTKEQIGLKKPFNWLIVFLSPKQLSTDIHDWYELLKRQSELIILLEIEDKYSITVAVTKEVFSQFIARLELSILKWDGVDNSIEMIHDFECDLMNMIRELEDNLTKSCLNEFNAEASLLEETKKRIIQGTNFSELAYRIATQDGDRALQNYLERLADKIPDENLNELLSNKGNTTFENIYRSWLFGYKCIKLSHKISDNKIFIAEGLNTDGLWALKNIYTEFDTSEEIFNV